MIKLTEPSEAYLASYMQAYDEYQAAGIEDYAFTDAKSVDVLQKFADYRHEHNLKPNRVGADYYWLVDDETQQFIGEITIRHRLNAALTRIGGHIGYGVRLSEQGKGFGTMMLKLALQKAAQMGLSEVLITCDEGNIASRRVMEKNSCMLIDVIPNTADGKDILTRRYIRKL